MFRHVLVPALPQFGNLNESRKEIKDDFRFKCFTVLVTQKLLDALAQRRPTGLVYQKGQRVRTA